MRYQPAPYPGVFWRTRAGRPLPLLCCLAAALTTTLMGMIAASEASAAEGRRNSSGGAPRRARKPPADATGRAAEAAAPAIVARVAPPAARPEIRGFWVDAFNPGIKSRAEVDQLIARLQRAGCNTVFAQVRKRGDAYYRSRYEPLALDNRDLAYDPLAYLIERAHAARPRIAVHAWINACAVGTPFDPGHVLAKHPDWRSVSDMGENDDNEVVKIDPGVPGAAEWTYRVYLDVVRSYPVDGIHFDFIRYGGPRWGYAPQSVARFNARYHRTGQPAWDDPLWQQFRRDQVTDLVRKVYANALAVRPNLVVSAALIAWGDGPQTEADWQQTSAYRSVYQDWQTWLNEGLLDLACPMTYFAAQPNRAFHERWAEWVKTHQGRRAATLAVGTWLNPLEDSLDLVRLNQAPSPIGGQRVLGTLLYSYRGVGRVAGPDGTPVPLQYNEAVYDTLGRTVFAGRAPLPRLPWKSAPTHGHLKGNVLAGARLAWADGATITLTDQTSGGAQQRTATTSGTGFYAFFDLPPGTYTVSATLGNETSAPRRVVVKRGQVSLADFRLGETSGDLPAPRTVRGIGQLPAGTRVLLKVRTVTVGMDQMGGQGFFVADPDDRAPLLVRPPADLDLPVVRDDVITLTGLTGRESGGRLVLVADAVQVVGSRPQQRSSSPQAIRSPRPGGSAGSAPRNAPARPPKSSGPKRGRARR